MTIYSMVHKVLHDSREKLASQRSKIEGKKPETPPDTKNKEASAKEQGKDEEAIKVANALDYLAENFHLVEKQAGHPDEPQGPHQATSAPSSLTPPMSPGMTGEQMGAGSNQLESGEAKDGPSVLEPGQSGKATDKNQPPMSPSTTETTFPGDSSKGALETNASSAPGGSGEAPTKIAEQRAKTVANLVAQGKMNAKVASALILKDRATPAQPSEDSNKGKEAQLKAKAKKAGVPDNLAQALIDKFAEDALSPASVSGGTTPELQTASGANPAQSQGTEAGEKVPGTKGSDAGRETIQSNKAAINATKDAKGQKVRSEMAAYLSEPAMSSAHDNVLNKALDSTSSAGVKIAAVREMLKKMAGEDPSIAQQIRDQINKTKESNAMMGYPEGGAGGAPAAPPPAPMPGGAAPMSAPMPGADGGGPKVATEAVPSDAALAAAAQDVSPEELMAAQELLEAAMSEGGGDMMGGEPMGEPPAPPMSGGGAEEPPPAPPEKKEPAASDAPPAPSKGDEG